ncbi:MAG: FkbM family methyltransferase [Candidatus Accumulibacter sp.]|jgi:FkbM family methyltransferase|nr:FkbM family methyltransferase [Accumulibacter sp.]
MRNSENISKARVLFSDEQSLRIFDARIDCADDVKREAFPKTLEFTGLDEAAKSRLLRLAEEMRDPRREKFIYGAGVGCKSVLENMRALAVSSWSGIIDNKVTGERYGLPIVSFSEFVAKHKDALVLNSVGQPTGTAIHRQCVEAGIDCLSLFELDKFWDQYFDLPKEMGRVGPGEVFVHAGCYNGDTQKSYINWFGDTYARMVTFEPSAKQFALCREKLAGVRDMEIVQAGLSDRSDTVKFTLDNFGLSYIGENGDVEIQVVSLDEFMSGQRVTFIALDIEGEELAALRGAERIIRTQKPKLAISTYHKPEDMWELPFLIKEYNPDYQLYLRHYHLLDMAETVLYAL